MYNPEEEFPTKQEHDDTLEQETTVEDTSEETVEDYPYAHRDREARDLKVPI